jgi:hypothetical protein
MDEINQHLIRSEDYQDITLKKINHSKKVFDFAETKHSTTFCA